MRRFAWFLVAACAGSGAATQSARAQLQGHHVIGFQEAYDAGAMFTYRRDTNPSGCRQGTVIEGPAPQEELSRLGVRIYLDCTFSFVGNRVVFNAIDRIRLGRGWVVVQTDLKTNADDKLTRMIPLVVPTEFQTRPLTVIRLTASPFRSVHADIMVTIARFERIGKDPPFPQCAAPGRPDDNPFEGNPNKKLYNCSQDSDCAPLFFCSRQCGNRCAPIGLPF